MKLLRSVALAGLIVVPILAQPVPAPEPSWAWGLLLDARVNFRDSTSDRFALSFPFSPEMLPPGASTAFMETVDGGSSFEASLLSFRFDIEYGSLFAARAKVDAIDLYDRNPTGTDDKVDIDELWFRIGPRPEGLDLPDGTSFFVQVGKAPKMERQPVLLLESYGLVHTAFNRMEDVQLMVGGSIGQNVYWRAQIADGSPLFFRDPNALAGDNGIPELLEPFPDPVLKSGFPILYDAETDNVFFSGSSDHLEYGGALGYRWLRDDLTAGFDLIAYYYERELAEGVDIDGTFYGGDLDLLDGVPPHSIPTMGDRKDETGFRFYGEWGDGTLVAQYVTQEIAGLGRDGWEVEAAWFFPLFMGRVTSSGAPMLSSIQPAARFSTLEHDFRGVPTYPAPSVWWDWEKLDVGVVIGFYDDLELTIEHAFHDILIPVELDVDETLVTLRYRFRPQ